MKKILSVVLLASIAFGCFSQTTVKYNQVGTDTTGIGLSDVDWYDQESVVIFNYENQNDIAVVIKTGYKYVFRTLDKSVTKNEAAKTNLIYLKTIDENGEYVSIMYDQEMSMISFFYEKAIVCFRK
jgi:hypothetical protein